MSRPPLDFHIGTHKTGSTTIQWALGTDRDRLARLGVYYPRQSPEFPSQATGGHLKFTHAMVAPGLRDKWRLRRFRRRLSREARDARKTVMSAESVYRHTTDPDAYPARSDWWGSHEAYLRNLAQYLCDFDTRIVLYFRQPHAYAESLFRGHVAKPSAKPLPDFATMRARRDAFFDYARHIDLLTRCFPAIDIRQYEAEAKGGLVASFYAHMGLEPPPADPPRIRTSMSNRASLWIRNLSGQGTSRQQNDRILYALRDPDGLFREEERSTLWESPQAQREFAERHARSFALDVVRGLPAPDRPPTVWTERMQAEADAGQAAWCEKNRDLLELRHARRLSYFHPDPAR